MWESYNIICNKNSEKLYRNFEKLCEKFWEKYSPGIT